MDKKIKKVLTKEKGAVKETKELLKMDKKTVRRTPWVPLSWSLAAF